MGGHWTDRLSEYLDGELNERDRAACAAHLEDCEACARMLDELVAVKERAAALPTIAAPADLWDAIEAGLEPESAPAPRPARRAPRAWPWTLAWSAPSLAAAAAGLVLVTAAATWTAARFGVLPGVTRTAAPLAANTVANPAGTVTPAPATPAGSATSRFPEPGVNARTVDFGEQKYDLAIADLERELAEHRGQLDTTTVRVVEKNLALIDAAIADARKALAADPASPYLNGYLASTMKRKVELLRRVTAALRT
jgi:hypothetical protein